MQKTKIALSQTFVILSPFGQIDFGMKQHKVCTFKWTLSKIAIFDLYLVFSCTITYADLLWVLKRHVLIALDSRRRWNLISVFALPHLGDH